MIQYFMRCPVHMNYIMETNSNKLITRPKSTKKEPIFECPECKRYYMYDLNADGKILGKVGMKEVFGTSNKYTLSGGSIWKSDKTILSREQSYKNGQGVNANIVGRQGNQAENIECVVRVKRVNDKEAYKAKTNLNNIRNEYPEVATEKMSVFDFMLKVFGSDVERSCVVRNASLMWKGSLVKKVEFYVTDSTYLKNRLPQGIYILFGGKISNGEFIVDEIRIIDNPIIKNGFQNQKLKFLYDGPKKSNWFYSITEKEAEVSKRLTGEIASWNEYIEWKRQLSQLRIKGVKYIAFKLDLDERQMTFLTVTEGMDYSKEFRKYLHRNEVGIFSNNYSKNRWYFEFNADYQDNQDSGIDVTFIELGDSYLGNAVKNSSWASVTVSSKKYNDEKKVLSFGEKIVEINRNYFEPYYQEIVFELSERAIILIKREMRKSGFISDKVEESIAEEFYGDGYIATSQIGDFTLLSRLQRGISELTNGKAAQQSLDEWLFDISRAEITTEIPKITEWQNAGIKENENQRKAVEKILAAKDVCLIQGPPGTGKTTVIAEAIYQLVIRDKRVLVASQANLAVDNALERLISNPKIRAIRLGNSKKIDGSVNNITEENVLETFYESIVDYLQESYMDKWEEIDQIENDAIVDVRDYLESKEKVLNIKKDICQTEQEVQMIQQRIANNSMQLQGRERELEELVVLEKYIEYGKGEPNLIFRPERISCIWEKIEQFLLAFNQKGIFLTRVGIDVDSLDSEEKISVANRTLKYVILNYDVANKLFERMSSDIQFGGETSELEELKLKEQELRERLMTEPDILVEWQSVNAKIRELSLQGIGISDVESALFDNLSSVQDKRKYILDVFNEAREDFLDFKKCLLEVFDVCRSSIEEEILGFSEEEKTISAQYETVKSYLEARNRDQQQQKIIQGTILTKYNATDDDLVDKVKEYRINKVSKLNTSLDREEWEDIFTGLRKWVYEIPDYSQEKDIFLRDYINGCNVVGVSCTENARTLTENGFDAFDVVIIDEVSKATPPELLIPMLRGRKIVLVGDHRQLPPLFNEHEKSYEEIAKQHEEDDDMAVQLTMDDFKKYKDMVTSSLFERHFERADKSIKETLNVQYRMHSDIMDIINLFYDDYLKDGNEDNYTEDTKAHYLSIPSNFGTEMIVPERHAYWFDSSQLAGERIFEFHRAQSTSCENLVEAETIIELLRKMEIKYANMEHIKEPVSIGVISFYFDQVSLLRKMIKQESFYAIDVEVNTVDRFQGKEKEIVFVSLVRNVKNPKHNLDSYIATFQRINVAFSRAQNMLIIVGATDMYAEQPVQITDMNNGEEKIIRPYKAILEMMDQRGTFFNCDEVIQEQKVDEILDKIEKQGDETK